jgi:hypothetical protein
MNFLKYIESFCIKNNIELIVSDQNRVNCYSIKCNGFFDNQLPIELNRNYILDIESNIPIVNASGKTKMVLAYSRGGKTEDEILSLVAHEFSHANQYLEGSDLWMNSEEFKFFDSYFEDAEIKKEDILNTWIKIVHLEADCENRVLSFIDKFNLNLDKKLYAQRANAYLFFYWFALEKRSWYKTAPYELKDIVSQMPTELKCMSYYSNVNNKEIKAHKKLFEQCFNY